MNSHIRPMTKSDGPAVAQLHQTGIHTGFLSSLGHGFLKQLYKAIPSCPSGFGFVWRGDEGQIVGFVACAESVGRLYRQTLCRRGILMAIPLIRFMFRPSVVRRVFQTLRYPSQVGSAVPPAELLSIVVADEARGLGVGKALVAAAIEEFRRRGIDRFKAAVWAGNEVANGFYRACGFRLAVQREHHGLTMNVYVIGPEPAPAPGQ